LIKDKPMNMLSRRAVILFAIALSVSCALAQTDSDYDALVQKGKAQLQAGSADGARSSAEEAIKMNASRWEGYALAGGALMNLKRYEEAADKLSEAIKRAPEAKQPGLRDLRRQCLLAESGAVPAPGSAGAVPATGQAEIVLWKTIENSTKEEDFQSYLNQFPQGAFTSLARSHIADIERAKVEQRARFGDLPNSVWMGQAISRTGKASENNTVVVIFLPDGKVRWRGYYDDKEDRPKLERVKSDIASLTMEDFIGRYRTQLRNEGTFAFENGAVHAKFVSDYDLHCQLTFEAQSNQNSITGATTFVGDGTKEARRCEKWPAFDWKLERVLIRQ
jgi:tetratricopeptide (TPR) repeat protein